MSFDSMGGIGKTFRKSRDTGLGRFAAKTIDPFGKFEGDTLDPGGFFAESEVKRLEVPAPPPTRAEADVNLARLDARERKRRSSRGGQTSQGLGTPQLSQPTLSQRLG